MKTDGDDGGTSLAAHFEARRRILATVKLMQERGEQLEEATPEEILEAASKSAETVFKFDFSITDKAADNGKKRKKTRKRMKKRRAKKTQDDAAVEHAVLKVHQPVTMVSKTLLPHQSQDKGPRTTRAKVQHKRPEVLPVQSVAVAPFVKLRKATGTESEVAKMHLRYGQGRRNLAATKQREQRQKALDGAITTTTTDFRFNFSAAS